MVIDLKSLSMSKVSIIEGCSEKNNLLIISKCKYPVVFNKEYGDPMGFLNTKKQRPRYEDSVAVFSFYKPC